MKIQIIGFSGAGKSTLAKTLSNYYNIPLLYLDHVQFYDDWQERTTAQKNIIVKDFLDNNYSWVIDGNYTSLQPQRFKECDILIYLDYNRFFCLFSCIKRYLQNIGKTRESCPCKEKIDLEFIWWILYEGRTKQKKQKFLKLLNESNGQKLHFKNRKQLNQFLKKQGIQ